MEILLWVLCASLTQEERLKEGEYEDSYARVVRAYEEAEKKVEADPTQALRSIQEKVLPRLPKLVETTLVVVYERGINKGAVKERHPFYPYRLAGRCALDARLPELAVGYLEKSPSSGDLLDRARKALADRPPVLQKPLPNLSPFLERHDYAGALALLPAKAGPERDRWTEEICTRARARQAEQTAALARMLPRLGEPGFRREYVQPCLEACSGVPPELETRDLRWVRRLDAWLGGGGPEELDRLALEAARFDPDFHVLCEFAQKARLREIEAGVEEAARVSKAERRRVLEKVQESERAFRALSAARGFPELGRSLAAFKERLPIDDEALDRARAGVASVRDLRVLADELERLWISERRTRLSMEDRKDLALYLGMYRSTAIFLDGGRLEEVAADSLVREAFRSAGPLPDGVSPKLSTLRRMIK